MKKKLMLIGLAATLVLGLNGCGATPAPTSAAAPAGQEASATAESAPTPETESVPVLSDMRPADRDSFAKLCPAPADLTAGYRHLEVTGTALPMDLIFSRQELELLAGYGFEAAELAALPVSARCTRAGETLEVAGLSLPELLRICGDDLSQEQALRLTSDSGITKLSLDADVPAMLVLTADGTDFCMGDTYLRNVTQIMAGSCCEDPHYEMHNRAPHDSSADITFTFNVYEGDALARTLVLTTAQLETLAAENPDAVYGAYYGVIGDVDSIPTMGGGGFLDYYEGLRLDWLLSAQLGIDLNGRAELFSREGEIYAEIADLQYFAQDDGSYYSCTPEGEAIQGLAAPILAYSKNGAPLLPDHEHDCDGYISSNPVKDMLKGLGLEPKLGTVKNHSGPFVAALGNCTGYYGGYQMETSADCVRMDIYLGG